MQQIEHNKRLKLNKVGSCQEHKLGGQLGSALGQIAASTGQLGIAGTKALGDLGLQQGALGELGQTLGQREG